MLFSRLIAFFFIVFFPFAPVAAQTAAEKTKETETRQIALLEQIAKDAEGLRLSENRALVAAKLGEGFWRFDEKRAREYFQTAINELIAAQMQAEADKKQASLLYSLINGVSPRQEILTMIAARDAELALDSFYKSRPAKISQILINPEEFKKSNSQQFVQNEIYFEQTLITRVGEQNPQRALKLIRESLSKGITYEIFGLIEKIKAKDAELAAQLAGEVADKLLAADFGKTPQDFSTASSFVTQYGNKPEADEKPLKVDEKKLRDLTATVAKTILKGGDEYSYEIENLLPVFEKYSPENLAALKQRLAKVQNTPERRESAAYEKLMGSEPSPEKILSEAEKYSEAFRNQMYYAAAEKSAQNGNFIGAQKIIISKMSQEETESYLTQINHTLISKAIADEKYDEAALLINEIPTENSRFTLLVELATSIYQKNPAENKKQTLAILEQARALIPQPAETLEEMSNLMQLAITIAEIEPEQSFVTIELMTQPINEYVEASIVVSKYRGEGTLRQGEIIINGYSGVMGLYNINTVLTTLGNKNFKRTMNFINGFQRMDVRLSLLLQMIESPAPDAQTETAPTVKTGG